MYGKENSCVADTESNESYIFVPICTSLLVRQYPYSFKLMLGSPFTLKEISLLSKDSGSYFWWLKPNLFFDPRIKLFQMHAQLLIYVFLFMLWDFSNHTGLLKTYPSLALLSLECRQATTWSIQFTFCSFCHCHLLSITNVFEMKCDITISICMCMWTLFSNWRQRNIENNL